MEEEEEEKDENEGYEIKDDWEGEYPDDYSVDNEYYEYIGESEDIDPKERDNYPLEKDDGITNNHVELEELKDEFVDEPYDDSEDDDEFDDEFDDDYNMYDLKFKKLSRKRKK